nr:MAG TPA: hypothetical protein [Caudoviricetes sp.]
MIYHSNCKHSINISVKLHSAMQLICDLGVLSWIPLKNI